MSGGHRVRLRGLRPGVQAREPLVPGLPSRNSACARAKRGQSLVEFTLVVPFLLILLLTVADFGRYFAAAIRVESIARTAAEVAAQEYLRAPSVNYATIHGYAWQSVCDEADGLANVTYYGPATECDGIATRVCVHDGIDPICDTTYNATGIVLGSCPAVAATMSNVQAGGTETSRYVEVRACYRFSTILPMKIPFVGGELTPLSGDFYVEKVRTFTVADY